MRKFKRPAIAFAFMASFGPSSAPARTVSEIEADLAAAAVRTEMLNVELAQMKLRAAIERQASLKKEQFPLAAPPASIDLPVPAPSLAEAPGAATEKGATPVVPPTKEKTVAAPAPDALEDDEPSTTDTFAGLKLGVGLSYSIDLGDNRRVKNASVVDGIVRVNEYDNNKARIILEAHHFLCFQSKEACANRKIGIGPFVGIMPGSDTIIDAIGGGLMLGFRRPGSKTQSFNIGLGVLYDVNSQILGDGIFANRPLPGNETEVRYTKTSQSGLLVMTSFSF